MVDFYDVDVESYIIEDNDVCDVNVNISVDEIFGNITKEEYEEIIDCIMKYANFSIENFVDRIKRHNFCEFDKNKLKELINKI
jgi:allophanate hydrolase subunit 1